MVVKYKISGMVVKYKISGIYANIRKQTIEWIEWFTYDRFLDRFPITPLTSIVFGGLDVVEYVISVIMRIYREKSIEKKPLPKQKKNEFTEVVRKKGTFNLTEGDFQKFLIFLEKPFSTKFSEKNNFWEKSFSLKEKIWGD